MLWSTVIFLMAFPGVLCTKRLSSVEYHTWKIGPITTVPIAVIRAVRTTSCSRNGTFSTYCCAIKSPAPRRAPANETKPNSNTYTVVWKIFNCHVIWWIVWRAQAKNNRGKRSAFFVCREKQRRRLVLIMAQKKENKKTRRSFTRSLG